MIVDNHISPGLKVSGILLAHNQLKTYTTVRMIALEKRAELEVPLPVRVGFV